MLGWETGEVTVHEASPDVEAVRREMASAVVGALGERDRNGALSEHCARVAGWVGEMAEACRVTERLTHVLEDAARLHEVGRIALPAILLDGATAELNGSFGKLRAHARIGAEIVRATRGAAAGWLVEQQYSDYEWLRRILRPDDPELLLAGILRVADVADAVTHPRGAPVHAPVAEVLRRGRELQFHPYAVDVFLELAEARMSDDRPGAPDGLRRAFHPPMEDRS